MTLPGNVALGTEVETALEEGTFHQLQLIRFDLPGRTVAYHNGGRPYTYNGLVYLPNRFLDPGELQVELGMNVTRRTIQFSNVPTTNADDAIAALESFEYPNAPVVISTLLGDPKTKEALGVLVSHSYEIDRVAYVTGAMDDDGGREVTVSIDLEPPSRATRDKTLAVRSVQEHQFDNAADDTFLAQVSQRVTINREWGQRSG